MKNDREYRTLNLEVETRNEAGDPTYIVRGYASTFEPYVLFEDEDGTQYKEVIEPTAFDEADLSRTAKARGLFEDISAGNYPKQSFAFTVKEDSYDKKTHTRTIKKIAKVFDVSPVSFPANPTTELDVKTRDYFNGVIEAEKAERLLSEQRARAKELLKLKIKLMESATNGRD